MAIGMSYKNMPYGPGVGLAYQYLSGSRQGVRQGQRSGVINTYTKKRKSQAPMYSLKKQVMKLHPAKHYTAESSVVMTHNTIVSMCPTQGITQGDGNTSRDGDAIHLESLKIKGVAVSDSVSNGYQHRILVGWSGEEITTANIENSFVSGLGSTELFLPSTGATWGPDGLINPKAFTVLYDTTIDINSQVASTKDVAGFAATIPIQQDFSYQASASKMGKTRNLFIVIIPAVVGGSTGVTGAGNVVMSVDLIFKNA